MYKDVGKRILAVMLCICMLVAMGHISNLTVRADGELTVSLSERFGLPYTGKPQPPEITSVVKGGIPVNGESYTVSASKDGVAVELENIKDAGTYVILVSGNPGTDYTGNTGTVQYLIPARDLAKEITRNVITVKPKSVYVGTEITLASQLLDVIDTSFGEGEGTALNGVSEESFKANPEIQKTCDFTYRVSGDTSGVGTLTVTINGKNNYKLNTADITYEVSVVSKGFGSVTGSTTLEYAGTPGNVPKNIQVTAGAGGNLTEGSDYRIDYFYENGRAVDLTQVLPAGKYYYNVIGLGEYRGTESLNHEFVISKSLDKHREDFSLEYTPQVTYTGAALTPQVKLYDNGTLLTEGSDYTIEYNQNTNVGDGYIFVSGTGEVYQDITYDTFEILPISLTDSNLQIAIDSTLTYNMTAQTPEYRVLYNNQNITENLLANCDVACSNNQNAGTGLLTITPKEGNKNYTGSTSKEFTINRKYIDAEDITVSLDRESYNYTGQAITPGVTLSIRGEDGITRHLTENTDFTVQYNSVTDATNYATLTIEGINNYRGSRRVTYVINPLELNGDNAGITVTGEYVYTGRAILPTVEVTCNGKLLTNGVDYEILAAPSTGQNIAAGEATVEIRGINNYAGSMKKTFTIAKKDFSEAEINITVASTSLEYNAKAQQPKVNVTYRYGSNVRTLQEGTDYLVIYSNNTNVTTEAVVAIEGITNFSGTDQRTFAITPKALTSGNIAVTATELDSPFASGEFTDYVFPYFGDEVDPGLDYNFVLGCWMDGAKVSLTNRDYSISYEDNDRIGEAQMVVTASGNYQGTVKIPFYIKGDISDTGGFSDAQVTVTIKDHEYTGSPINLTADDIEVTYQYGANGECQTLAATDYQVVYQDEHTQVGTASVQIKATTNGNYVGQRATSFQIKKKAFDLEDFQISIQDQVYTGQAFTETEIKAATTITYNGNPVDAADYDLTFLGNNQTDSSAQVAIRITAKENAASYTGSMDTSFAIVPRTISQADLIAGRITAVLNGGDALVLVDQEAITLTEEDVSLSYDYNGVSFVDADITYQVSMPQEGYSVVGSSTLEVEGTGNFQGTISLPVMIYGDLAAGLEAKDQDGNPITVLSFDREPFYAEMTVEPEVTVTYRGQTLELDADFQTAYSGNRTVVTDSLPNDSQDIPKIVFTGIGDFAHGEKVTQYYAIQKCDLQAAYDAGQLTLAGLDNNNIIYNETEHKPLTGMANQGNQVTNWNDPTAFTISYENNVNGGVGDPEENDDPPTVIITATDDNPNYTGKVTAYFTIRGISFENYDVSISEIDDLTFTGSPVAPGVTVTVAPIGQPDQMLTLRKDQDYTISYQNAVNAGSGEGENAPAVVITGINNFEGTLKQYFTILPKSLDPQVNPDDYVVLVDAQPYTGNTIVPQVQIIDLTRSGENYGLRSFYFGSGLQRNVVQGWTLENTDYSVTALGKNQEVGTRGLAQIDGQGNYTGTMENINFAIVSRPMSDEDIVIAGLDPMVYQGTPLTPAPQITLGDLSLVENEDYTLTYQRNTDAGTAQVVITGNNVNFTGTRMEEFEIQAKDFATGQMVVAPIAPQILNPEGTTPVPVVSYTNDDGTVLTLEAGKDFTLSYANNTAPEGNTSSVMGAFAAVYIDGKGNYTGQISQSFMMVGDIASAEAQQVPDQAYTGEALVPEPVLTLEGQTLVLGTDYMISYKDNVEAGQAAILVTGIGRFGGTLEVPFLIIRNISDSDCQAIGFATDYTYSGQPIEPIPGKVMLGDIQLTEEDYTLRYENNTDVGVGTIILEGQRGYVGQVTYDFNIIHRSIAQCSVEAVADVTYNGLVQTPGINVAYQGVALTQGQDYSVVYLNNEKPGTARIIINGRGNYAGSKVITFKISMNSVSGVTGTSTNSKRVTLNWTKDNAVTGYEVYDTSNHRLGRVDGNRFTISGLKGNTGYTYKVRSYVIQGGQTFYSKFTNVTVRTQ